MMTQSKPMPPVEVVRELLDYDPNTGIFRWKVNRTRGIKAGDIAGYKQGSGYIVVCVKNVLYFAHRLAWLYVTGEDPGDKQIDHINLNKSDNRFSNLRLTNKSGNGCNSARYRNNTSGIKGVTWNKRARKWRAEISVNGKNIYLGSFIDRTEARRAVAKARNELHRDFARHS